jgi:hypothetical protein
MDYVGNILQTMMLSLQLKGFYERGIKALVNRWQKCIKNGGDYVDKITVSS